GSTNRVGFINKSGKIVIKPAYTNCSDFINGYALVRKTTLNSTGVIDRTGKIIIPLKYWFIWKCKNGLFLTQDTAHYLQLLTTNGRNLLPKNRYVQSAQGGGIYDYFAGSYEDIEVSHKFY